MVPLPEFNSFRLGYHNVILGTTAIFKHQLLFVYYAKRKQNTYTENTNKNTQTTCHSRWDGTIAARESLKIVWTEKCSGFTRGRLTGGSAQGESWCGGGG